MTSGNVMDRAAGLLNDTAKTLYTYTAQLPYLNMAIDELSETCEANNVAMTNEVSAVIPITTTMKDIGGATGPALPADLIEIQSVFERTTGASEDFQLMVHVEFLPEYTTLTQSLIYWTWQKQIIQFLGAITNRDIKIDYIGAVIINVTDVGGTDVIPLFNSKSFLSFRTAALCAEFIGENPKRAEALNGNAQSSMERFLSINIKGKQSIATRRRPFMSSYKQRASL